MNDSAKKGGSVGDPLAKFNSLWKEAQFIKGHICGRHPALIPRIPKEEAQQQISEDDVMTIDGVRASQSVFIDEEAVGRLATMIRGKMRIEIHPAVTELAQRVGPAMEFFLAGTYW